MSNFSKGVAYGALLSVILPLTVLFFVNLACHALQIIEEYPLIKSTWTVNTSTATLKSK